MLLLEHTCALRRLYDFIRLTLIFLVGLKRPLSADPGDPPSPPLPSVPLPLPLPPEPLPPPLPGAAGLSRSGWSSVGLARRF